MKDRWDWQLGQGAETSRWKDEGEFRQPGLEGPRGPWDTLKDRPCLPHPHWRCMSKRDGSLAVLKEA